MRLSIIPKQKIVQEIKNNLQNSKAIIFWNFRHVDNEKIFALKKELKKVGGFLKVYKITLVKRALDKQDLDFQQPTALIFCQADEHQPLQVLNKFEQENYGEKGTNTKLEKIEGGWYGNNFVSAETLQQWAKLPSKKELLQVFCHYLQWNLRKLTSLLHSLASRQESENY